jgi:PIN domain nuclease of toxin-antitoxin system
MSEAILLDTCALLWLATGHKNLSNSAKKRINQAGLVGVSSISAWEIGLKTTRGELELPEEPEAWFEQILVHHDLRVYEITTRIAFQANRLPWHHRDPADRLILATAMLHGMPIVTSDGNFSQYGVEIFC